MMDENLQTDLTKRYQEATDSLIDKVTDDPNVIAVILGGSLSYDQVWEKSDIDMTLVVRDQNLKNDTFCLVEDDITINAYIVTRSDFKRYLESQHGGSFIHSYFSKGTILYSTDDSLYEYFEDYKQIGKDDIAFSMFTCACDLHYFYEKSQKWIQVKKDPLYAQYYILKAAELIARMEILLKGEIPTREAIRAACDINPDLISLYYQEAMSHKYSEEEIMNAISKMDQYMEQNLEIIKKPLIDYMSDGEMKTVSMISKFFRMESHMISGLLEYFTDKGILLKLSKTIRITPKSKLAVEEIVYQYLNI